jgi:hypothetical protein
MRPRYESDADRTKQNAAAKWIEQHFKCKIIPLSPGLYQVDWALFRARDNTLRAWAEYKCRGRSYDDHIISVAKMMKGFDLTNATGAEFVLFVENPSGLYSWTARDKESALQITIGGRTDRNDPADLEPVVRIPFGQFKRLRGPL